MSREIELPGENIYLYSLISVPANGSRSLHQPINYN